MRSLVISQIPQSNCCDWGAVIDYMEFLGQRNKHTINYIDRKLVGPRRVIYSNHSWTPNCRTGAMLTLWAQCWITEHLRSDSGSAWVNSSRTAQLSSERKARAQHCNSCISLSEAEPWVVSLALYKVMPTWHKICYWCLHSPIPSAQDYSPQPSEKLLGTQDLLSNSLTLPFVSKVEF